MQRNWYLIIFTLITLHFLFGNLLGYSQEVQVESYCLTYKAEMIPGESIRLIPEKGDGILIGQISKKVDLNVDGLDDLIVKFPETCGNSGDCVYGIYVQEADGRYTCVFPPDYWYSGQWDILRNEYNVVNGVRWMKLRLYSRTDYGGAPAGLVPTSLLQFNGEVYEHIELQSLGKWPKNIDKTETFGVEKEYQYQGKTYQVGRLLLKDFKYGPLTLRTIEKSNITDICAPMDEYPDLEMSETRLIRLHNRPFFFVIDRYRVYLIDLKQEKISVRIEPGQGVEYGDDSISGTVGGFQFFDQGQYLIGTAASYGVFCFDISDMLHPKELKRYSSDFSDRGQPYFFLKQNADGTYDGIISRSDTTKRSTHISNFYTETIGGDYLFQDAYLTETEGDYADPADYEIGDPKPFLLLQEQCKKGNIIPWVVDLETGVLLKGESAQRFMDRKP